MRFVSRGAASYVASLTLAALGLVGQGCGRPYEPQTPDGFVELTDGARDYDSSAHEYRASTADGVVLGVRAWENEPKVDLGLAVRALETRVRLGEGYALLSKKDVRARDATKGVQLDFGHDESGDAHHYSAFVFVTDDYVYIVEAGGKKDLFERARPSIDWFIKNFDPS